MTEIQFNNSGGLVLNVIFDESQIFAYGTRQPQLVMPITFKAIRPTERGAVEFEVSALHCQTAYRDDKREEPLGHCVPTLLSGLAQNLTGVQVLLPLDHARLGQLEALRNGRDSFEIQLDLQLLFRKLQRVAGTEGFTYGAESIARAQGRIVVPKGVWCGRVLPDTGFGSVLTVEFSTVPVGSWAGLPNAVAALQKAQRLHRDGYYDGAVGECRVALDKFWDENPKRLKDSWATKLGAENHEWLNEAFTILRREGNDPHHNAIGKHFDQLESQLILMTTTALIAMVARSGVAE